MSVNISTHGALEQPTSVRLTSTSITDIYTATNPNGTTVVAITLANETAGAVIVKPAHETFWGGYAGYFKDPDGHLWEVAWNPQWVIQD